jgi:hypothetical protein
MVLVPPAQVTSTGLRPKYSGMRCQAHYNVPVCHVTRLRGALTEPVVAHLITVDDGTCRLQDGRSHLSHHCQPDDPAQLTRILADG